MRRKIMIPVLAALLLYAGCGGTQTVTITVAPSAGSGLPAEEMILVALDRAFQTPIPASLQSSRGSVYTYTAEVPAGTTAVYWRPFITAVRKALAPPAEGRLGADGRGVVRLNGEDWMTVEPGINPETREDCLAVRVIPGCVYYNGNDFSLIEPDGTVLHGANLLEVTADDEGPGESFRPGYLRFHDVGAGFDYAGCILRVGEGLYLSVDDQPTVSADLVQMIVAD